MLNGNQLTAVPLEIGFLTDLEKLFLQNNKIAKMEEEVQYKYPQSLFSRLDVCESWKNSIYLEILWVLFLQPLENVVPWKFLI